jgi:hypothetical protein
MKTTIIGPMFVGYSSVVWSTIVLLELSPLGPWDYIKCQSKQNQPYNSIKGTGFLTKKDLIVDQKTFLALKLVTKKIIAVFKDDCNSNGGGSKTVPVCKSCNNNKCKTSMEACLINQWWNRKEKRCIRKMSTFYLPTSIKFMYTYNSLSTVKLFQFVDFILNHPNMKNKKNLLEELINHVNILKATLNAKHVNTLKVAPSLFSSSSTKSGSRRSLTPEVHDIDKSPPPPPPDEEEEEEEEKKEDEWGADGEFDACQFYLLFLF